MYKECPCLIHVGSMWGIPHADHVKIHVLDVRHASIYTSTPLDVRQSTTPTLINVFSYSS